MKTSRERDQSIERLLRQLAHQTPVGAAAESCLDPEAVAAWVDGGLSGAALESARSHAADCGRCQALVGTFARVNAAASAVRPARAGRGWLRWLVPVTAAAAGLTAVALWVTVPRSPQVQRPARETPSPTAPFVGATKADGSVDQTADARGNSERQAQSDLPAAVGGAVAGGAASGGRDAKDAAKELAPPNQPGAQGQEARNDAGRLETGNAKLPASPSPTAAATPPAAAAGAAARTAAGNLADQVRTGKTIAGIGEIAAVEIRSPDPAVRWRITGSTVHRSTDGGSTWREVSTGFQGQLTAGAAPSSSVCWLVGRGGFMMIASVASTGVSWRRVSFPEPTDLSAVRATDALSATVTAVDGRTFTTTDGGATWARVPPQDF